MPRQRMPIVQRVFNTVKGSKEPLTVSEIQSKMNGEKVGTTIYALIHKGAVKRALDKGDKAAYVATGMEPTFGPARTRRKRKPNTEMVKAVVDSPAIAVISPEQVAQQAQEEMAQLHSAVSSLQSASLFVKFAVMLERHGPEQMLLMLNGMDRLRHK
jgi:DNA-binding transcriptional regulator GbsR (MarR family)